jgi:hypothetical protein
MEPPPNFLENENRPIINGEECVCKVKRGLYGLKQSGYEWAQCFKEFMTKEPKYNMDFTELTSEPNMYRKKFAINNKIE